MLHRAGGILFAVVAAGLDTAIDTGRRVCLGATAAQALLGNQFRVTKSRGQFIPSPLAPHVMATVHPSSILRAPDAESRRAEMELFVADLRTAVSLLKATNDEE